MFDAVTKDTLAPLLLRIGVGAFFIVHGLEKVSLDNDWGFTWARNLDEPPPPGFQVATAWCELAMGVLLAGGFFTRLAALGAGALTVALAAKNVPIDVNAVCQALVKGDAAYNVVLIAACAALVVSGGGTVALDHAVRRWRQG
jgi:uncharacterized membrane protein YphA (DoxX/SURF4 family)